MKALLIALLLLLPIFSRGAELIPLRDPVINEPRPSWWLSCWGDHIVVIEGTIRFEASDPPDLELTMSDAALRDHLSDKDRDFFQRHSKFFVGQVQGKMLFASPGVAFGNLDIAAMKGGGVISMKALIPTLQLDGNPPKATPYLKPGMDNTGVFIFRWRSMIWDIPLLFSEPIPADGLESAAAVFKYRESRSHHQR